MNRRKKQGFISFILTVFVVGLLLLSGPASAIEVAINNLDNIDVTPDASLKTFEIEITVNSGEFLPIYFTDLIFSDGTNTKTCRIESDNTDNCDFLIVNSRTISGLSGNYGYGYGYGYDMNNGYGYQDFGYGYGYSYGTRGIMGGAGSGTVTYSLSIDPEKFPGIFFGNMNVEANVYGGTSDNYAYFKGSTTFTVSSSQSSTPVTAGTGATITYGDISVTIPANVLSADTSVTVQQVASPANPSSSYITLAGKVYEFGPSGTIFSSPVTITLPYNEEDLAILGITDETKLQPAYYNTATSDWEILTIVSRDTTANTITFEVNSFSKYAVAEDTTPASSTTTDGGRGGGNPTIILTPIPTSIIPKPLGCAPGYRLTDRDECVLITTAVTPEEEVPPTEGGAPGITGMAVTGNIVSRNPVAATAVIALTILVILGIYVSIFRKKKPY